MKARRIYPSALVLSLLFLSGCYRGPVQEEETLYLIQENAASLPGGESADLWQDEHNTYDSYRLSDGTSLLTVYKTVGPDNYYVAGTVSFNDLNESARKAIDGYYEEQGLLYDTETELQKAYEDYLSCRQNGTVYQERHVRQEITPSAANDTMVCFITIAAIPVSGQESEEIRLGAVFNRETGAVYSNWDLFSLPEEEARQWLLDASDAVSLELRGEMEAALRPEYILLFPTHLEITYPRGTLPSQEYSTGIGLNYDDRLLSVLEPWAVPDGTQNAQADR